jgi:hypothetical protein
LIFGIKNRKGDRFVLLISGFLSKGKKMADGNYRIQVQ